MSDLYQAPDLCERVLRVGAFDITFRRTSDAHATSERRWGAFSAQTGEIEYQTFWPCRAKFADTVAHEINHAIYWAYGIDDDDKEERVVATFASAWIQVYRDNRWLLDLLKELTA